MKDKKQDPRAEEFDRFLEQCTEDGIPQWMFLERYSKLQQEMDESDNNEKIDKDEKK